MPTFNRSAMLRLLSCWVLCGVTVYSPQALADGDPAKEAAAQALYTQATTEMDAGKFSAACPKLEEVTRLVPHGVGARLTLAECYEGQGRLASAWSSLEIAKSLAEKAGQRERAREAGEKAAALRQKLALLTVKLAPDVRAIPDLTLLRDGVSLGASFDTPLPIDEGAHVIEVKAPGYTPYQVKVRIAADGVRETVTIAKLVPQAGGSKPVTPESAPPFRALGWVGLGVGVVGLGAGGVLTGLALAKKDESNAGPCDAQNICTNSGLDLRGQALGLAHGATGSLVVGGVFAAAGITLLLIAPKTSENGAPAAQKPSAGIVLRPNGVGIHGTF